MDTILFTVVLTLFGLYAGALALNLGGVATKLLERSADPRRVVGVGKGFVPPTKVALYLRLIRLSAAVTVPIAAVLVVNLWIHPFA